jgi:AraC-like ligand binding domain
MDILRDPEEGAGFDARQTMYPSELRVRTKSQVLGTLTSTCYCVVLAGSASFVCKASGFSWALRVGGFVAIPGTFELEVSGPHAKIVCIERFGFRALPMAGCIEEKGRLSYIDGCSDSILCMPPRQGDPVLNHLHFPVGVRQTEHTHPSLRLGAVLSGRGEAFSKQGDGFREPLAPGAVFWLHPHEMHAFSTQDSRSTLDVVAYHPDSDWGPTDSGHPMLNRTYLVGR